MDAKKDSIINVFTKSGKSICGRFVGERKGGTIRIALQRRIVPDDKLLGKGVRDRTLIRCSKDIGDPIDIHMGEVQVWACQYVRFVLSCV